MRIRFLIIPYIFLETNTRLITRAFYILLLLCLIVWKWSVGSMLLFYALMTLLNPIKDAKLLLKDVVLSYIWLISSLILISIWHHLKISFDMLFQGGLVYSNKVVVVSSLHSKGRIISNLSHGLEHTLSLHSDKLLVSPYGFDDSTWDPSKDKFLPQNYNEDDIKGKAVCKVELQRYLGLPKNSTSVLVGCILSEISDLDLDNLKAVVRNATRNIAQFIFMGSKMPSSNKALESLQKEFKGENVRVLNKYDEAVSHLILGGSDVMLCQSFHDPLLQVPLKALKYGAAPIAVASNAIKSRDFVDHDLETTVFSQFISSTFGNLSLIEAMNEMKNNPSKWRQKIVKAMSMDFSWDAECYNVHVSAYDAIKKL